MQHVDVICKFYALPLFSVFFLRNLLMSKSALSWEKKRRKLP